MERVQGMIILFHLVQLVIGGKSIIMIIVIVFWLMILFWIIVLYVVLYLIWGVMDVLKKIVLRYIIWRENSVEY